MLWEKIEKFWRTGLANIKLLRVCSVIVIIFLFCVAGCSNEENSDSSPSKDSDSEFMADIGSIKLPESVEEMRGVIQKLGKKGYAAVDSENQIDMTEASQIMNFCNQVEQGKRAEVTILVISYDGGITKYHLKTEGGKVDVDRRYYQYQNESLQCTSQEEYPAYSWVYTDDGYLFFQKYHMSGYDGSSGYTALRVQPLDEDCRDKNRRYILPVSYKKNNLFLHDWNENDYSDINFYDMFDILYPLVYGKEMPYTSEEIDAEGRVYRIPAQEFEKVILSYFNISIEILRSRITYFSEENEYEYRPRGLYDREPPGIPYPEVTACVYNSDGTITLTVHAVYPEECTGTAFVHEVTVRPLKDGGVQYVSNRLFPSEDVYEMPWHANRLTKEQWQEYYENN